MTRHCVYRAFDGADRLLYVGCTNDIEARMKSHAASSPWFIYMARHTTDWYDDREEAERAEARAIAEEHPRWNMSGRSPDHPDGFVTNGRQADWLRPERELATNVRRLRGEVTRTRKKLRRLLMDLRMEEALAAAISNGSLDFSDDDDELLGSLA